MSQPYTERIREVTGRSIDESRVPEELIPILTALLDELEEARRELSKECRQCAFLRAAANAMPNPIFIKDDELRFLFFNESYKRFFGIEEGQYIGKRVLVLDYLSPEDGERYHKEDSELLSQASSVSYEMEYTTGAGAKADALYWSRGFEAPSTGERGIVGEIVDISREKSLQRQLSRQMTALQAFADETAHSAKTDPATRLYNRRVLLEDIPHLIRQTQENGTPLSAFMMDIDHFKGVNDTFGHPVGDEILAKVGEILSASFRQSDIAIRYGGDEFLAILPGAKLSITRGIAERIRDRVREEVCLPDGRPITLSIGIAELMAGEDVLPFISRTDEVLYRAKREGRDRICDS